jgi:hypothetical protein
MNNSTFSSVTFYPDAQDCDKPSAGECGYDRYLYQPSENIRQGTQWWVPLVGR